MITLIGVVLLIIIDQRMFSKLTLSPARVWGLRGIRPFRRFRRDRPDFQIRLDRKAGEESEPEHHEFIFFCNLIRNQYFKIDHHFFSDVNSNFPENWIYKITDKFCVTVKFVCCLLFIQETKKNSSNQTLTFDDVVI